MSLGKRLLLFSPNDPQATALTGHTADWGCLVTTCQSVDELRGRIEGAEHDMILLEGAATVRRLVGEADPNGDILRTPLAEVEKRHILRVLSSTGGNKTRAARVLGIDTKTLYNKLKSYGSAAAAYRRRANQPAAVENSRTT
jgi:transcriptional regulator with GAF, ATPase, and Fis domain